MAYFTAVVVRTGGRWKVRDVEVGEAGSLGDLADMLGGAAGPESVSLALLEREDEWFAIVRLDDGEDPRVFVSDVGAARHSAYAAVLLDDADLGDDVGDVDPAWTGDVDLLSDLGLAADGLEDLVERFPDDPGAALAEVSASIGVADLVEALR